MSGFGWILPIVAVLTFITLRVLLGRGWAGHLAIDVPNARSLHASPIPRVGGLIMIPVALIASLLVSRPTGVLQILAAGLCAISFIDDRWGLPVAFRLICHTLAAVVLCHGLESSLSPWTLGLASLAVIWFINMFNFMDGTDGLAGGMALIGFSILGWALLNRLPAMSDLALCLAASAAGFLILNFSPARVFMGDAGSVPLGFLAGGIGLTGWRQEAWPLWFPLLVFSPFLVDASLTLMKRLLRRERFWRAHRDHYYQRVVRLGWSHRRLALVEYALMLACGGSALALRNADAEIQIVGLSVWAAAYTCLILYIDSRRASAEAERGGRA